MTKKPRPCWTPEQNKVATDALSSYLRTGDSEGLADQGDPGGGFLVPESLITDMYEGAANYAARLTRSRWNVLRRLLGRTCESCRSYRQLQGDPARRCAWDIPGDVTPWGKAFYPSAKASCRRWERRGGPR